MTIPIIIALDTETRQAIAKQRRALYWRVHEEYTQRAHGRNGYIPSTQMQQVFRLVESIGNSLGDRVASAQ